jgi:hypothetical protein
MAPRARDRAVSVVLAALLLVAGLAVLQWSRGRAWPREAWPDEAI